ncbi:MAG TPA: ATP-binding protein [Polyangiaceae bacterium]|nr:ATP-binding protein [Polyangiaceae bacterium]
MSDTPRSLDDIAVAQHFELEELLDRPALLEMTHSFEQLFGVALRVYSSAGTLLADTSAQPELYKYLETTRGGRAAVQAIINEVRRVRPSEDRAAEVPCVSGGKYLAMAIVYEGQILGRTIFGPFLTPGRDSLPDVVFGLDEALDPAELRRLAALLPHLTDEECQRIDRHLRATLDLLVFSGLKAHLASNMHMASVRESFRELSDKNKKLQLAYDRLKELDRLKSNFLATVSHELRTPLTSIIGYSEMLLEGIAGELVGEQREFVGTIHEKGEQLLGLIKSLLDLSKLESGTMSMRREMVSPRALIDDVVATLTPTARKRGVSLQAASEGELSPLYADGERLRQVLLNLTENAIKFTPEGGQVLVSATQIGWASEVPPGLGQVLLAPARRHAIEFRVADSGIGIAEEERERVFDAFYQVDSSATRQAGGAGLGLSIVKRLVDSHDGKVRVQPNSPSGTVFVVTIPIKKAP